MHAEALDYIASCATALSLRDFGDTAIDIGGRETNGHARYLFPKAQWIVVDAVDGPGVDVVADGREYQPLFRVGLVLFAEVAEHTPFWREILVNISTIMLKPGGHCIMTMAGPGRAPHGLFHDDPNQPGYYANILPAELDQTLDHTMFSEWYIDQLGEDVRAWARV